MFKLADGRQFAYQWDSGIRLEISIPDALNEDEVHFWRSKTGQFYKVKVDTSGEVPTALIPDVLFETSEGVAVYYYRKATDTCYTADRWFLNISPRNKPSNYRFASIGNETETLSEPTIVFYDYDGYILYNYTLDEVQALTELPPAPEHEGLVFQGWNWSLEDIKRLSTSMNVGATYITDDGSTRLYIKVPAVDSIDVPLHFTMQSGSLDIDWGDGTRETITELGEDLFTHTYNGTGEYVISLHPSTDCLYMLGYADGSDGVIGSYLNADTALKNLLQKAELGHRMMNPGANAFKSCYALEYITIPNGITGVNERVFVDCYSLKALVLPNGLIDIECEVFYSAKMLCVLALPNSLINIREYAFANCYNLRNIIIPNSVKVIENCVFENCMALTSVVIPNGLTQMPTYLFDEKKYLKKAVFSNDTITIPSGTFNYCNSLSEVSIPETVKNIGASAFINCGLKTVKLPSDLKTIGSSAFSNCDALEWIIIPDGVETIEASAFAYCNSLREAVVPASVTSIGNNVFMSCASLSKVTLAETMKESDAQSMFSGCNALKAIVVPSSWENIPASMFNNCCALTSVYLPENLNKIKSNAFMGCYLLMVIKMPSGVTSIESSAFSGCLGMKVFDFTECQNVPALANSNAFDNVPRDCVFKVPSALAEEWKAATNWNTYAEQIVGV